MSARILGPLATGFEEIEAVAIVDVLRRAELDVVTASLERGLVEGAHGIRVEPDAWIDEVELDTVEAVVLPGGMPGTRAWASRSPSHRRSMARTPTSRREKQPMKR